MTGPLTVTCKVHFTSARRRKQLRVGESPECKPRHTGRVPRLARLMALAIKLEELVRDGKVTDYAELARLGHVTRARMTQIMNLVNLAPDIQEEILFLPLVEQGRAPITERDVRPIAAMLDWDKQRSMWRQLVDGSGIPQEMEGRAHR